jgi:hypothetical protein
MIIRKAHSFLLPRVGQVEGIGNATGSPHPEGWALLFHPDLIRGTSLGRNIKEYTFFSYESNEALNLSEKERQIIVNCLNKIDHELHQSINKHTKKLVANNIELLINYCMRFYDKQFITRSLVNKDILVRFENLPDNYLKSEMTKTIGLSTIKYCADPLHLSANYFGDLIKKETGIRAEIYHMKQSGLSSWKLIRKEIHRIDSALLAGLDITADMYNYIASQTGFDIIMPDWVQEVGDNDWVLRIGNPEIECSSEGIR